MYVNQYQYPDLYRQLKEAGAVTKAHLVLKKKDWYHRESEEIWPYITYYFDKDDKEIGYICWAGTPAIHWISRTWSSEFRAAHEFSPFI